MRRLLRSQKGFTLVELLVVIAIIVALAAAIIPNIARFAGSGEAAAADAELDTIQTALDTAMAEKGFTTVNICENITDPDGGGLLGFGPAGTADIDDTTGTLYLYPEYLREEFPGYGPYSWNANGLVAPSATAP